MRNPLSDKIVSIPPSGIRKFFDIVNEMEGAISLGVGEPDFDTPWHIREEGIYSLEKGRTFYTSNAGLKQLRIAETEKYAHVTSFFNGSVVEPNPLEERILVPSPKVATYDLKPEMSACEVTEKVLAAIDEDKYAFILLNFTNPDMVGHTGVFDAAVKAVQTVDECLQKVIDKVLAKNGAVLLCADHGNVEKMYDENGGPFTAHTSNLVPFIAIGTKAKAVKCGSLQDVAPTVLDLLEIAKPALMTGQSLLEY